LLPDKGTSINPVEDPREERTEAAVTCAQQPCHVGGIEIITTKGQTLTTMMLQQTLEEQKG